MSSILYHIGRYTDPARILGLGGLEPSGVGIAELSPSRDLGLTLKRRVTS